MTEAVAVPSSITIKGFGEDRVCRHHVKKFPLADGGELCGCVNSDKFKQAPREDGNC